MKAKLSLPVPWYSIEEVAEAWSCSVTSLHAMATAGDLELCPWIIDGAERTGVTAAERQRIEQQHSVPLEPSPQKIRSALFLLGAMLIAWTAEDEELLAHHYALRDDIARTMAAKGIAVLRTRETDSELIREALEVVRASGRYAPKQHPQRGRAEAEAMELVDAQRNAKGSGNRSAVQGDREAA